MEFITELGKRKEILEFVASNHLEDMEKIAEIIFSTIQNGNKVMTIGNGGSAANAQHITGDIIGRYKIERRGYPAITLTVDPSVLTALSNDYGYNNVFSKQVEGLGKPGDLLIVLSSSATSENIKIAVDKSRECGIKSIGVLGNKGGNIVSELDYAITFDFKESDLVEETTMTIFHIVLMLVERKLVEMESVKDVD